MLQNDICPQKNTVHAKEKVFLKQNIVFRRMSTISEWMCP